VLTSDPKREPTILITNQTTDPTSQSKWTPDDLSVSHCRPRLHEKSPKCFASLLDTCLGLHQNLIGSSLSRSLLRWQPPLAHAIDLSNLILIME
jgi:hypothetical protein